MGRAREEGRGQRQAPCSCVEEAMRQGPSRTCRRAICLGRPRAPPRRKWGARRPRRLPPTPARGIRWCPRGARNGRAIALGRARANPCPSRCTRAARSLSQGGGDAPDKARPPRRPNLRGKGKRAAKANGPGGRSGRPLATSRPNGPHQTATSGSPGGCHMTDCCGRGMANGLAAAALGGSRPVPATLGRWSAAKSFRRLGPGGERWVPRSNAWRRATRPHGSRPLGVRLELPAPIEADAPRNKDGMR